jgi:hypothetical protein
VIVFHIASGLSREVAAASHGEIVTGAKSAEKAESGNRR